MEFNGHKHEGAIAITSPEMQVSSEQPDPVSTILSKRLVFLVGVPRSGTTWLQLMLASSSLVATVNETHLFSGYLSSLFTEWTFRQRDTRPIGLHEFIDEEEFLGMVRSFACSVIMKILAKKTSARVILEKTPRHLKSWADILKVFPDAYFLHLVRDPRSVVSSLISASQSWGRGWGSVDEVEWCERWIEDITLAQQLRQATDHYMQVRYEDLMDTNVQAPILRSVFLWLGIQTGLRDCLQIIADHSIENLKQSKVETAMWNLRAEPAGFFRLGELDSWKKDLTVRRVHLIERRCAKLMVEFGYTPTSTSKIIFPLILRSYLRRAFIAVLPRVRDSYRRYLLHAGRGR
jgi:hypothetical protein